MPAPLPQRTVLIVDDGREFLAYLEMLLTAEGYRVVTAGSLAQARLQLADRRLDVVVSDARLPDGPPFAILDVLAADEKLRDLPVLFCTGAVVEVEAAAARLAAVGAVVMRKPFDSDDFLATLRRLCPPAATAPRQQ